MNHEGEVLLELGDRMKKARLKRSVLPRELAEVCGVSRTQIVNIEAGISRPGFMVTLRLLNWLKIKPKELLHQQ